jgi:putative transposase
MLDNEVLSIEIRKIFEEHKGRYGSIRISKALEQRGITVNRKRVAKLMRNMKLVPRGTRYRYKRYNQESSSIERPNLLNQVFKTDEKTRFGLETSHIFLQRKVYYT